MVIVPGSDRQRRGSFFQDGRKIKKIDELRGETVSSSALAIPLVYSRVHCH